MADDHRVEIVDLGPGLWIWRARHHGWREGSDWDPIVTSVSATQGNSTILVDPLTPSAGANELWRRLDSLQPAAAAVLKPDHLDRGVEQLVRRYGMALYGPDKRRCEDWRRDIVLALEQEIGSEVLPLTPGEVLPGGLSVLDDGRGKLETPLWLPEHKVIVFADALTERSGTLRVWTSARHDTLVLPALRSMLDLPFERVIISHGNPVHDRAAFEHALTLPPWPASALHLAAWEGDLRLIEQLLAGGADAGARDELQDATPADWARTAQQSEAAQLLESSR